MIKVLEEPKNYYPLKVRCKHCGALLEFTITLDEQNSYGYEGEILDKSIRCPCCHNKVKTMEIEYGMLGVSTARIIYTFIDDEKVKTRG